MILGALATMAQNKVLRLFAYSSIGHVGYFFYRFLCGTIEGIQSLLIGVFIYVLMTINIFSIVLASRQNCFKYIADLSVLAKTNPILAITLFIIMFSYARIPSLAEFCRIFFFLLLF
jgi:NADH-ubiquinone oxidoreductase chain 2